MAKKLSNRSKTVQFLKTSTPGRIQGLYSSSLTLKPGQTITVADADFAVMTIDTSVIDVQFVEDAVIDTKEEVEAIGGGITGPVSSDILPGAHDTYDLGSSTAGWAFVHTEEVRGKTELALTTENGNLILTPTGLIDGNGKELKSIDRLTDDPGELAIKIPLRRLHTTDSSLSIDWDARQASDAAADVSLDWQSRRLLASDGNDAVHWGNRTLGKSNGVIAMAWETHELKDASGVTSLYWENRTLRDPSGNEAMDWNSRELRDSSEIVSILWNARRLMDESGAVAFGWSTTDQAGATGSRPTGVATGYMFFDTTLGIPIWWNGTDWVNATGATV